MATCPSCRTRYPDDTTTCEVDGDHLLPDQAFRDTDIDLVPGQIVGEYRIEAKIGQGGFGCVYRAIHPVIGKAAAIKVLNRQYSSSPQMVSRFIAEARAVNQIRNRNIIDIFSFGTLEDGRQYYVMELLEGATLDRWLKQKKRMSPEEAVPIFRGIARALDAAHAAGIAHRDLKPENVFLVVEDDGVVFPKLLDFGIAKLMGDAGLSHKTRTGQPIGTPYYMSPEQCRGKNVDHRTDIYSLGILVHEALTGKLPFTGEAVMDLLFQQTSAPAPPVSSVHKELPRELDAPVLHLLAKDPDARPASASEGIEALARASIEAGYDVPPAPRVPAPRGSGGGAGSGRENRTPSGAATLEAGTPVMTPRLRSSDRTLGEPSAGARTLLDAEADIAPPPRRRTAMLVAALSLAAGMSGALGFMAMRAPVASAQTALAQRLPPLQALRVPAPAAAPAVAPAPPEDVELTIQTTPREVDVYRGDERLGSSSAPIKVKRGDAPIKLTLKAAGYAATEIEITPSANGVVSATLARITRPARTATPEVEF